MENNDLLKTHKEDEDIKEIYIEHEELSIKKVAIFVLCVIIILSFIIMIFVKIFSGHKHKYDYLIVGSGLYGATFNYFAKKAGKKTLVIEKRNVTGGNLYCEKIEDIFVHKYGPHIFHTSNKTIWDLVNSLVELTPFQYQPLTKVKNKLYNSQYTMWAFNQLWGVSTPEQAQKIIDEQKFKDEIYNLQDQGMSFVGKDIYKTYLKGYLTKEWNRDDEELPPFIIPYLPLIYRYDTSYLNDTYQGIPVGCYNSLIDKLLNDTEVILNVDFIQNKENYKDIADKIIFTGKIDEFYNYTYTPLDYRSLKWNNQILDIDNYQGTAVIHYPEINISYIRTIEYKHLEPHNKEIQEKKKTVVSYEYVSSYNGDEEPLYPYNDERSNNIYMKYKEMAEKEPNIIFRGRLATYKYYSMADVFEEIYNEFNNK